MIIRKYSPNHSFKTLKEDQLTKYYTQTKTQMLIALLFYFFLDDYTSIGHGVFIAWQIHFRPHIKQVRKNYNHIFLPNTLMHLTH